MSNCQHDDVALIIGIGGATCFGCGMRIGTRALSQACREKGGPPQQRAKELMLEASMFEERACSDGRLVELREKDVPDEAMCTCCLRRTVPVRADGSFTNCDVCSGKMSDYEESIFDFAICLRLWLVGYGCGGATFLFFFVIYWALNR